MLSEEANFLLQSPVCVLLLKSIRNELEKKENRKRREKRERKPVKLEGFAQLLISQTPIENFVSENKNDLRKKKKRELFFCNIKERGHIKNKKHSKPLMNQFLLLFFSIFSLNPPGTKRGKKKKKKKKKE